MKTFVDSLGHYRRSQSSMPSPDHLHQAALVTEFENLASQGAGTLLRSHQPCHFTGSALVASLELDLVLLTLHSKLGLWLQLGGHADGDSDLPGVAMRECKEESGLEKVNFFPLHQIFKDDLSVFPIFDLDIHTIPARKDEPQHQHFDVRYLFLASPLDPFVITPESKDLRWVPLTDAYGLTAEPSMHRQFDKLSWVKRSVTAAAH